MSQFSEAMRSVPVYKRERGYFCFHRKDEGLVSRYGVIHCGEVQLKDRRYSTRFGLKITGLSTSAGYYSIVITEPEGAYRAILLSTVCFRHYQITKTPGLTILNKELGSHGLFLLRVVHTLVYRYVVYNLPPEHTEHDMTCYRFADMDEETIRRFSSVSGAQMDEIVRIMNYFLDSLEQQLMH